jgi:opacity protein-like surface antigen
VRLLNDFKLGGVCEENTIVGGLEYGFTPNLSAKLEYLYITAASLEVSQHSEIRAGLNYRFGGM